MLVREINDQEIKKCSIVSKDVNCLYNKCVSSRLTCTGNKIKRNIDIHSSNDLLMLSAYQGFACMISCPIILRSRYKSGDHITRNGATWQVIRSPMKLP